MTLIAYILAYCALFGMLWFLRYVQKAWERHDEDCRESVADSSIDQFEQKSRYKFEEAKADVAVSLVGQIAAGTGMRCEYCHSIVPKDKINCPNCGAPR